MQNIDVAAYVWPAYTGDDHRSRIFWEEGMGEWQSVKNSVKKFEGHNWPRKPLWGYVNEADPYVMEMQINAACDHGINVFIYDWYWYDNMPFLENCLNDGYLKARNNDRVKFYIMWANHDVNNTWDIRNSHITDSLIWNGAVNAIQFDYITDRLINLYLKHPSYYCIDNKPVIAIYDLNNLLKGLGGVEATKRALSNFRDKAVKMGLFGLHLQLIEWGSRNYNLSGVDGGCVQSSGELIKELEFDSITNYQFAHLTNIDRNYNDICRDVLLEWDRIDNNYSLPFFPHVSIGWDNNPRFMGFKPGIMKDNTPQNVGIMFRNAKKFIMEHPKTHPLITVNSWNEWTESSYLQPDDLYGYGYLQAVKNVFG